LVVLTDDVLVGILPDKRSNDRRLISSGGDADLGTVGVMSPNSVYANHSAEDLALGGAGALSNHEGASQREHLSTLM
jgi:hypothetical protein